MGSRSTVVQISDTHLSACHGWFYDNWRSALRRIEKVRPNLVINSGDLSVNGAGDAGDLAFALAEHGRLTSAWCVLPGNHDVGEEPGALHLGQPVDGARLARYRAFGNGDRWVQRVGSWRLLGLNSQLFGTGLPEEYEQLAWLAGHLTRGGEPIGLFLHKPLFVDGPDDDADHACVPPESRRALLELIVGSSVAFVASGHLHEARIRRWEDVTLVWCPSTAFPAPEPLSCETTPLGWVEHRLDGARHDAVVVSHPQLVRHDLDALKGRGRYDFLYQTPSCPPSIPDPVG